VLIIYETFCFRVFCGFGGAFWVWLHRRYVKFMRKSKRMKRFLERNRFLYPGVVALTISLLTCPLSLGQFMGGELTTHGQVDTLFANFSFIIDELEIDQQKVGFAF
jgi:chloride channel 2